MGMVEDVADAAAGAFGDLADAELGETLKIVTETARELGIPTGENLKAMLDAHSVSFSGGTIALDGGDGVPLRALGVGSTRLLVAGLQRKSAIPCRRSRRIPSARSPPETLSPNWSAALGT